VNVVLHAFSAIVLWRLLLLLEVPGALLGAAVFALHPVHVESVAWISERKNVLSGLLYLLSALVFLRHALREGRDGKRPAGPVLSFALYLGAILSKTVTASLPIALGLVLVWKRKRIERRDLVYLGGMLAVGILLGQLTVALETHQIGTGGEDWSLTFPERLVVAGRAFWFYLGKLLVPARLTFLYPRFDLASGHPWTLLLAPAAALLAVALFAARKRIGAGPALAITFFGVTLGPALGFFDLYPMRYTFVADHFQYLASIGPIALFAAAAATVATARPSRRRAAVALASALLLVLAALTFRRAIDYRSAETLWRDTIAKNPSSWMAHNNLAILLAERGDTAEAIENFEASLRIRPDHAGAHANLGYLLTREGSLAPALEHLREASRLAPDDYNTAVHLGDALGRSGDLDGAAASYRAALRIRPESPEVLRSLGLVLARRERPAEAIRVFRDAVRLLPDDADLRYNLGTLLARTGSPAEAIPELERAVALRPGFADAERNLALARAEARSRAAAR
jgi:tetratricopeptide (TPR) repeat protein